MGLLFTKIKQFCLLLKKRIRNKRNYSLYEKIIKVIKAVAKSSNNIKKPNAKKLIPIIYIMETFKKLLAFKNFCLIFHISCHNMRRKLMYIKLLLISFLVYHFYGCLNNPYQRMHTNNDTPPTESNQSSWHLIWNDEFEDNSIDTSKWNVMKGLFGPYTVVYFEDLVSVSNGCLVIKSEERMTIISEMTLHYASGLLYTKYLFSLTYGRIEVKGKLPSTKGMWPGYWLLANNHEELPPGVTPSEIDIMEMFGHDPCTIYMTTHFWDGYKHCSYGSTYTGQDFSLNFHIFAIEWEQGEIRWYVDDTLRFTSNTNIPDHPHFIVLDTQVGGSSWGGDPDASTIFPQYHYIDYIRVYQKK